MSIVFVDGCDPYATADRTRKWTAVTGGNHSISSTGGRFGGGCYLLSNATGGTYMSKTLPASATWVVEFAFKLQSISGTSIVCGLLDASTTQCDLRINTDGTLSVTRNGTALTSGTSTNALSVDTWYFVEWKVTIADSIGAGTCVVRVNETDWVTVATGQDTKQTANASANVLRLGSLTGSTGSITASFDDIFADNGTAFLGDCRVETLYPSGAGNSTGLTASTGSNYQCVDDSTPNDDTDYVSSATPGTKDTYAFGDLSSTPDSILGVQVSVLGRKAGSGGRTACPVVRSGGADYDGTTTPLLDSYSYVSTIWETDPATAAAWTASGVNNAEFGQKVVG